MLPSEEECAIAYKIHIGKTPHLLGEADFAYLGKRAFQSRMSGSDINGVVKNALMGPVRELQEATHFVDNYGQLTPCAPSTYGAKKMCLMELSSEQSKRVATPMLQKSHFIRVLAKGKAPMSRAVLRRFDDWTRKFGQKECELRI